MDKEVVSRAVPCHVLTMQSSLSKTVATVPRDTGAAVGDTAHGARLAGGGRDLPHGGEEGGALGFQSQVLGEVGAESWDDRPDGPGCLSRELATVTLGRSAFEAGRWAVTERADRAVRVWRGWPCPGQGPQG